MPAATTVYKGCNSSSSIFFRKTGTINREIQLTKDVASPGVHASACEPYEIRTINRVLHLNKDGVSVVKKPKWRGSLWSGCSHPHSAFVSFRTPHSAFVSFRTPHSSMFIRGSNLLVPFENLHREATYRLSAPLREKSEPGVSISLSLRNFFVYRPQGS